MDTRKRSQPLLALARQSDQDASAVGVIDGSSEKAELENYLRVSYFIDLMHAKARLSLQKHH